MRSLTTRFVAILLLVVALLLGAGASTSAFVIPVNGPDLLAFKSGPPESVGVGQSWTWSVSVGNFGNVEAGFPAGTTLLRDHLPNDTVAYAPSDVAFPDSVAARTGVIGEIECIVDSGSSPVLECTAKTDVAILGAGSFTVEFNAVASATGTYTNPDHGGCAADPDNVVAEIFETNNACPPHTVVVTAPNLVATKSNDVGGKVAVGGSFTWTIAVRNVGDVPAEFADGATILLDHPPLFAASRRVGVENSGSVDGVVRCGFALFDLECFADGPVTIPPGGGFDLAISVSDLGVAPGDTLTNPDHGGCAVDPDDVVVETDEADNACGPDTVVVTAPNLVATKSNDVGGKVAVGGSFTWTIAVRNVGDVPAEFAAGSDILYDDIPDLAVPTGLAPENVVGVDGLFHCGEAVLGLAVFCSAEDVVTIQPGGGFDLVFSVTGLGVAPGDTLTNPDHGGCAVDPDDVVVETDEADNACGPDTVVVASDPDLVVSKTSDTGGSALVGETWTWTLTVQNLGDGDAVFSGGSPLGDPIVSDTLPNTFSGGDPAFATIGYGSPAVTFVNVVNGNTVACNIAAFVLTCRAGSDVVMRPGGSITVRVTATPTAPGTFANPLPGGSCLVDPGGVVAESDEANNLCNVSSVLVTAPDLRIAKSNDTGGELVLGGDFAWTLVVENRGDGAALFDDGELVLRDDLPAGAGYGTPTVADRDDIACGIVDAVLTCTAVGSGVAVHPGASFSVVFGVEPRAAGTLVNPGAGVCRVDPDDRVPERDEQNNDCEPDGVKVLLPAVAEMSPDTVNVKAKGQYVTVYVEGAPHFDVADIDPRTVVLTVLETGKRVPSVAGAWESEVGDDDGDGVPDRTLKFDRAAVHAAVTDASGNVVSNPTLRLDLLLTTLDSTGAPFGARGSDSVIVISEGAEHESEDHGSVVP